MAQVGDQLDRCPYRIDNRHERFCRLLDGLDHRTHESREELPDVQIDLIKTDFQLVEALKLRPSAVAGAPFHFKAREFHIKMAEHIGKLTSGPFELGPEAQTHLDIAAGGQLQFSTAAGKLAEADLAVTVTAFDIHAGLQT